MKPLLAIPAAIAAVHILRALTLDRIIQYVEIPFRTSKISDALDGYRIAFVTDTHGISPRKLNDVVERLNSSQIDLLLLGGDFHKSPFEAWHSIEILSRTNTADGIYGVEGNHDNRRSLQAAMGYYGIKNLLNKGKRVRENLFVAGTSPLRRRHPMPADIALAVSKAASDDFVLLLTHEPDIVMRQPTGNIDLILSGHTHGGQITLFGLWAPALTPLKIITRYGQRFMSGWSKSRDGTPVYVSNGLGAHFFRMFARPRVIIFTLRKFP